MHVKSRFTSTWINITVVILDETTVPGVYVRMLDAFRCLAEPRASHRAIADGLLCSHVIPGVCEIAVLFSHLRSVVSQWQGGGREKTKPILMCSYEGNSSLALPVPIEPIHVVTLAMFRQQETKTLRREMVLEFDHIHRDLGMAGPLPDWYYPEIPCLGKEGYMMDTTGPARKPNLSLLGRSCDADPSADA